MFPIILLLFLVVPIVELYVIVQVAGGIGVLETIGLLILISIIGAWLVRREGIGLIRRIQKQLAAGKMPGRELVDGALILFAGALMLTPGFVTDLVGLFLLLPPTRALIRPVLIRGFSGRTQFATFRASTTGFGGSIFDVGSREANPTDVTATGDARDDRPRRDPPTLSE